VARPVNQLTGGVEGVMVHCIAPLASNRVTVSSSPAPRKQPRLSAAIWLHRTFTSLAHRFVPEIVYFRRKVQATYCMLNPFKVVEPKVEEPVNQPVRYSDPFLSRQIPVASP